MDDRHREYLEYYQSRMRKYQNHPLYTHSYQTEKELYEAIRDSASLEEFGERVKEGNLAVKNAIALVKDHETARMKFYRDIKENIRLKAPIKILELVDSVNSDMELVGMVGEIEAEVNKEIVIDLFTDYLYQDFSILEEIEVYQSAEVPSEWKQEINHDYPQELIRKGRKSWKEDLVPQARAWKPDWNFDLDLVWEERHRRKIPVPDKILKKRIEDFKAYRGL